MFKKILTTINHHPVTWGIYLTSIVSLYVLCNEKKLPEANSASSSVKESFFPISPRDKQRKLIIDWRGKTHYGTKNEYPANGHRK